jgi:hypothetical protein
MSAGPPGTYPVRLHHRSDGFVAALALAVLKKQDQRYRRSATADPLPQVPRTCAARSSKPLETAKVRSAPSGANGASMVMVASSFAHRAPSR